MEKTIDAVASIIIIVTIALGVFSINHKLGELVKQGESELQIVSEARDTLNLQLDGECYQIAEMSGYRIVETAYIDIIRRCQGEY